MSLCEVMMDEMGVEVDGAPFTPRIFTGQWKEALPEGFNGALISLPMGTADNLDWSQMAEQAELLCAQGHWIVWHFDLGVFERLKQPLSDEGQFKALALGIKHFESTLYARFSSKTLAVTLFKGRGDWSDAWSWSTEEEEAFGKWQEERGCSLLSRFEAEDSVEGQQRLRLFCRDRGAHFLELLASQLPEMCPALALIDVSDLPTYSERAQMVSREVFEYVTPVVRSRGEVLSPLSWGEKRGRFGFFSDALAEVDGKELNLALSLPSLDRFLVTSPSLWEQIASDLVEAGREYRVIEELRFSQSWMCVDHCVVISAQISPAGKRMLQGFCAAGGQVVHVGESLGLAEEISWENFRATL